MQLAYELLPVWAGQDDKLPTAISHLRRFHLYLTRHTSFVVRRASHANSTQMRQPGLEYSFANRFGQECPTHTARGKAR